MADIGGFTYTILEQSRQGFKKRVRAKLTTASGEYPTGGIPLEKEKLGCPSVLEQLTIVEPSAADALTYKWDSSAGTIKAFVEDTGVLDEHTNATFTSPDELIVEAIGW